MIFYIRKIKQNKKTKEGNNTMKKEIILQIEENYKDILKMREAGWNSPELSLYYAGVVNALGDVVTAFHKNKYLTDSDFDEIEEAFERTFDTIIF